MFRQKFQNFMMGRYGMDQLNLFMTILALVLSLLSWFTGVGILSTILSSTSTVLFVLVIFRSYSRNISARYQENVKFMPYWQKMMTLWYRLKQWFRQKQQQWKDRKTHRYFSCPNCHQTLRVPKGKGKIKISCPKCRTELIRKT